MHPAPRIAARASTGLALRSQQQIQRKIGDRQPGDRGVLVDVGHVGHHEPGATAVPEQSGQPPRGPQGGVNRDDCTGHLGEPRRVPRQPGGADPCRLGYPGGHQGSHRINQRHGRHLSRMALRTPAAAQHRPPATAFPPPEGDLEALDKRRQCASGAGVARKPTWAPSRLPRAPKPRRTSSRRPSSTVVVALEPSEHPARGVPTHGGAPVDHQLDRRCQRPVTAAAASAAVSSAQSRPADPMTPLTTHDGAGRDRLAPLPGGCDARPEGAPFAATRRIGRHRGTQQSTRLTRRRRPPVTKPGIRWGSPTRQVPGIPTGARELP